MDDSTGYVSFVTHAYGALEVHNMADSGGEDTSQPGPVSFADLGIPQPPKLQDTLLGKVTTIAPKCLCVDRDRYKLIELGSTSCFCGRRKLNLVSIPDMHSSFHDQVTMSAANRYRGTASDFLKLVIQL